MHNKNSLATCLLGAVLLVLCHCGGSGTSTPTDVDAAAASDSESQADATASSDAPISDNTSSDNTSSDDASSDDASSPDEPDGASSDAATASGPDTSTSGDLYVGCDTLFAVRILELQIEADPAFDGDCNAPLTDDVAEIDEDGNPLCVAGESANACRERHYENPPSLSDLRPACWTTETAPQGCLRGKWLPRCADGTDDGCTQPDAVCQDGTRPMMFMEGALGGSNSWLFFMGGEGGPCSGAGCWYYYRYAAESEVSNAAFENAMSSLHPDHLSSRSRLGTGIMRGDATGPGSFADFNRVKFERCSDTSSNTVQDVELYLDDAITRVGQSKVYHRGLPIWRTLFRSLTTDAGRDLDGDGTPDLPTLADATTVVLAGSSDASVWIVHAADELAEELADIAGAAVDVRVVIDGYYEPSFDNEGRYAAGAPADFNSFEHPYNETGLCELPPPLEPDCDTACSDANFLPGPLPNGKVSHRDRLDARGSFRDASCEAMHGTDAPQCDDKIHVLFHHLDTAWFIVADQEDGTISGAPFEGAEDTCYTFADPATYRRRILDQTYDVRDLWATPAREEGAGTPGDAAILLRKSRRESQGWGKANHVHLGSGDKVDWEMTRCDSTGTKIASFSIGETLDAWLNGNMQESFIVEDAALWEPGGQGWITGSTCRPPE